MTVNKSQDIRTIVAVRAESEWSIVHPLQDLLLTWENQLNGLNC